MHYFNVVNLGVKDLGFCIVEDGLYFESWVYFTDVFTVYIKLLFLPSVSFLSYDNVYASGFVN